MTKHHIVLCIVIALTLAMALASLADVPQLISFQGKLSDNVGNPLNGHSEITFRIYNVQSGGTPLWSETLNVQCEDGLYSVILGKISLIALDFAGQYWLGVQITGEGELSPRYELTSVPGAFRAAVADSAVTSASAVNADKVDNRDADDFAVSDHQHDDRYYTEMELNTSDGNPPNEGSNRMSWDNLTDVPAGFADGTDEVGEPGQSLSQVSAGTGINVTDPTGPTATVAHATDASALPNAHHTKTTSASELNSGTLDNARFSAYSDLGAEGKIGTGSDQVSTGDHNHDADYVNTGQENSITSGMIVDGTIQQADVSFSIGDGHSLDAADGSPTDVVYVDNTGNVGIGITNPSEKLDVEGSIRASGTVGSGNSVTIDGSNHRINSSDTFEIYVNGDRALRIEPHTESPSIIGGFSGNVVTAGVVGAVIGGGGRADYVNLVTDSYGTVGGGYNNQAGDDKGTVPGATCATVGGGNYNHATADDATVGGGSVNWATNSNATISGGSHNRASGQSATIGGGSSNEASGDYATVGGGSNNTASDYGTTICGGAYNEASGDYATVGGGVSNTANGTYSFAAGSRAKANHSGTFVWGDATDADFASTGTNQFLIRASGGVGIGTNNPVGKLHIDGVSTGEAGLDIRGDVGNTHIPWQDGEIYLTTDVSAGASGTGDLHFRTWNGSNYVEKVIFEGTTGNVGIGYSNPSYKLDVNGVIRGSNVSPSDVRLKKDITSIENALEKVSSLRGVNFKWKDEERADGLQMGVIAQEVESIFPEAVSTDDGGYKSVAYGRLIAPLIEAIKELKAENEELRQRIESLEKN